MSNASIVIPTFNRAPMLQRCIEAALSQTMPCEVLVCDHGSTDETPIVAKSFGNRIRYIRREVDLGIHFAWLDGVISAQGEFIHLNYDDDYIKPEFMEKCLGFMKSDIAFCFTETETEDYQTKEILGLQFNDFFRKTGVFSVSNFMRYQINGLVSPGSILIRKKDLLSHLLIGRIPFAKHEYRGVGPDWLMTAMTTLDYPKFAFISEPLAVFGSHAGSITIDATRDKIKSKAINLAYAESRKYYCIMRLVQVLQLEIVASILYRIKRRKMRLIKKFKGAYARLLKLSK